MTPDHSDGTPVTLPDRVVERVEKRIDHTEFSSSAEYITYVLEEVLYRMEGSADGEGETIDEDDVKQRLKSLGYLEE